MKAKEDGFLAAHLGRPAFQFLAVGDDDTAIPVLPEGPVFAWCKLPAEHPAHVAPLVAAGFALVETSVQFERPLISAARAAGVRFAGADDVEAVRAIARTGFLHSRFHRDPRIGQAAADRIKEAWAGNFFARTRGTHMLVAERAGRVAGFLQLLVGAEDIVIDLIATHADFRRRGVARSLVEAAESAFPDRRRLRVGTQLANFASIGLYEELGLRLVSASHTLHLHRGIGS